MLRTRIAAALSARRARPGVSGAPQWTGIDAAIRE